MTTLLTDAQLKSEFARCESCEEKGCRDGCPANCSPADFIMAARLFAKGDFARSAAEIMTLNPLGGICGAVCPDRFCQAKCSHKGFDRPVEIPAVQATVVAKAKALGVMPRLEQASLNGHKVAVVGAGPAGVAAAAYLAQRGYEVTVFEKEKTAGGACNLIPAHRLDREILRTDLEWTLTNPNVTLQTGAPVADPASLLKEGFEAVVVAVGLWSPYQLGIPGEEKAIPGLEYLKDPAKHSLKGKVVAVVGGGATAVDCAVTAKRRGAKQVEMFALEKLSEMPLTQKELAEVMEHEIHVNGRVKLVGMKGKGIKTRKVLLPEGAKFSLKLIKDLKGTEQTRATIEKVIVAIGARSSLAPIKNPKIFFAGDCEQGPSSVARTPPRRSTRSSPARTRPGWRRRARARASPSSAATGSSRCR